MSWFPHSFEAPLERHGVGRDRKIWYNVLFLPAHLAAQLPFRTHPQLRVEGEIADLPMAGTFIPAGDGRHYVIVSPAIMREAGIAIDQMVEMRFRVADQEAVDVPEALADALARDADAAGAWEGLTPGRRRALAYLVGTARTGPTRDRRVATVLLAITGRDAGALAADVARLDRVLGKRRGAIDVRHGGS